MKNLLIFTGPDQKFSKEDAVLTEIQIDDLLELGWKKEDILLVTDFPYQYNGISSQVIPAGVYFDFDLPSSKTLVLCYLLDNEMIKPNEIYWVHDINVFQNVPIEQSEIESELGTSDMGLCDQGRMPMWNTGSIFFKSSSQDIFDWMKKIMYDQTVVEEDALWMLCGHDSLPSHFHSDIKKAYTPETTGISDINKRVKRINITYNFRPWNIRSNYGAATKPIRAVHMDPYELVLCPGGANELEFMMYGKNKLDMVLMPERLIKIFHKHGIK